MVKWRRSDGEVMAKWWWSDGEVMVKRWYGKWCVVLTLYWRRVTKTSSPGLRDLGDPDSGHARQVRHRRSARDGQDWEGAQLFGALSTHISLSVGRIGRSLHVILRFWKIYLNKNMKKTLYSSTLGGSTVRYFKWEVLKKGTWHFERGLVHPPPCAKCHMSCVTCHVPHVTWNIPHVLFFTRSWS